MPDHQITVQFMKTNWSDPVSVFVRLCGWLVGYRSPLVHVAIDTGYVTVHMTTDGVEVVDNEAAPERLNDLLKHTVASVHIPSNQHEICAIHNALDVMVDRGYRSTFRSMLASIGWVKPNQELNCVSMVAKVLLIPNAHSLTPQKLFEQLTWDN